MAGVRSTLAALVRDIRRASKRVVRTSWSTALCNPI